MDIVAIIACRNDDAYLGNCLNHLRANGISYAIIDHDSNDATREILDRPTVRDGLVHYETLPFDGTYNWHRLLSAKMELADRLGADWVIHHDADEVIQTYAPGETIADAIRRLSTAGATVINFDEYVFLPVDFD